MGIVEDLIYSPIFFILLILFSSLILTNSVIVSRTASFTLMHL